MGRLSSGPSVAVAANRSVRFHFFRFLLLSFVVSLFLFLFRFFSVKKEGKGEKKEAEESWEKS